MCKKIPFLVPRRNKSGRFDGFDELRQPVNRNVEIAPDLPAMVPQLLHLNLWLGAIVSPSPANPLGLPDEVTMALAFLTGKPGPRIVGISPLVKTQFKIWDRNFAIPGLTMAQREHFRSAVDLEVLTASVPPPSMGIGTDLRSRLLLTLAPSIDPCFIIGALSGLRGVKLVEPVTALYGPSRDTLIDVPVGNVGAKMVGKDYPLTWMHAMTYRDQPTLVTWDTLVNWDTPGESNMAILDSGSMESHPAFETGAIQQPDQLWFRRDMTDVFGHGTFIASQIVGRKLLPNEGVPKFLPQGVLPKSRVLCFNIFYYSPTNNHFEVNTSAFHTALKTIRLRHKSVSVINLSIWMKDEPSQTLLDDFADMEAMGIVIVACAGNKSGATVGELGKDSDYRVLYPARLPTILSVGAIDGDSVRAPFSRFSSWNTTGRNGNDYFARNAGRWPLIDLMAPGVKVWGAAIDPVKFPDAALLAKEWDSQSNGATRLNGTSMAAPYVTAGIAAIRLDPKWANATAEAVRQLVRSSIDASSIPSDLGAGSVPLEQRELYGTGVLDYTALINKASH